MSKRILFNGTPGNVLEVTDPANTNNPFIVHDSGVTFEGLLDSVSGGITLTNGNITVTNGNISIQGTDILSTINGFVVSSRLINTTGGLTGGGDLTSDRTLSIDNLGVTTAKINDLATTTAKIANNAVTSGKVDTTVLVTNSDRTVTNNTQLTFGSGDNFILYHNATNGFIDVTGSNLIVRAQDNTSTFFNTLSINGGLASGPTVTLYANGNAELSTLNGGGVSVVNNLGVGGDINVTGAVNMSSTKVTSLADGTASTDATTVQQSITRDSGSEPTLKYKVITLGDWNMDTLSGISPAHGLTQNTIRSVSVLIRNNTDTNYYDIQEAGNYQVNSSTIGLSRDGAGFFDSPDFNSTGFSRGWITIIYEG